MAFLGAAVRWPDALLGSSTSFSESCEEIADHLRQYLPRPLNTLSSSVIVSLFFTWVLVLSVTALSTALNARRQSLVPATSGGAGGGSTATRAQRKPGTAVTTLLVGPEQTGKSALYSALVFKAVPETQTSQHENETKVLVNGSGELQQQQLVHLVDLPGHSRLRAKVNDYLPVADRVVFCVDTASAIKGGTSKNDTLVEAVDHLHATLTTIARARLSSRASSAWKSRPPPSLLVLFTRGDLSPLLSTNAHDTKRQAQVLTRARAAFEAELGRRRAGMGLGRGGARAKVGGMSKVVGGADSSSSSGGWLGYVKRLIGLGGSSSSAAPADAQDDDEDEDEESLDYVDWAWAQRAAAASNSNSSAVSSSSTSFSLDKLDSEVVADGKAHFAVASLGKERGWALAGAADEKSESSSASSTSAQFPGLSPLVNWLVDPNV